MDSEHESSADELTAEPAEAVGGAGNMLRAAREGSGLDLAHVAAETRIPIRHLESIEAGSFDDLPSRTYAIGFARTYARVVGLNEGNIANAVREELSEGHGRQSALAGGMEPGDPAKLPSAGLAWFGAFAALILAVGMIAFYSTYFASGSGTLPSLVSSEEEPAEQDIATSGAGVNEAQDSAPSADGEVVFTALEDDIWVRFYELDGERLFERTMASGDTFSIPAEAVEPRINTGRPDALGITIGGQSVPKLADEPITMGDTPISASALLARANSADEGEVAN